MNGNQARVGNKKPHRCGCGRTFRHKYLHKRHYDEEREKYLAAKEKFPEMWVPMPHTY